MTNRGESLIEQLPLELKLILMSVIPDLSTLRSFVCSCRLFYEAFLSTETLITTSVLHNEVDPSILPEAIAAHHSARLSEYNRESISKFAAEYLAQRPMLKSWTLADALPISRQYGFVRYWADRFASTILAHHPPFTALGYTSPRQSERRRFERALYRFEIYINLFRSFGRFDTRGQRPLYFSHFAPFEHEQIACIHDLLVRAIAPTFNDVVDHTVQWHDLMIPYIDSLGSYQARYLLKQGLEKLYAIAEAKTLEARRRLLQKGVEEALPGAWGIQDDLWYYASPMYNGSSKLAALSPDEKQIYFRRPFFDEPDSGPVEIHQWVNRHLPPSRVVGRIEYTFVWHRAWAYVMWDMSRLEAVGAFRDEPEIPEDWKDELELYVQEDYAKAERRLWDERS